MITDFVKGLSAYVEAIKLSASLRLWKYYFIPGIISLIFGGLVALGVYSFYDNIGTLLLSWYPFEFGLSWMEKFTDVLGISFLVIAAFIIYKNIIIILVSPFMGPLSEKIEKHFLDNTIANSSSFFDIQMFWTSLRLGLRNLLRELLMILLVMILAFIPIFGLISSVIIFLIQAYYAGFGNMDYTLERHYNYKSRIKFVKDHKGLALANGSVFLLLLLIPIFGLFVSPVLATIAASTTIANKMMDM